MAKLISQRGVSRPPAHRGRFVVSYGPWGSRVSAWPQRQVKKKSQAQQDAMDWFAAANRLYKLIPAEDQLLFERYAKGTRFYPRDLFLMCLAGRLGTIYHPDGRKLYPMAARRDVSDLLDVLSQTDGTMLRRINGLWEPITPGAPGQVLTMLGATPTWVDLPTPPAGGGFNGGFLAGTGLAVSTSNFATKGLVIVPQTDLEVTAISAWIAAAAISDEYAATIAELDDASPTAAIVAILATTPNVNPEATALRVLRLPFTDPISLSAGVPYLIAVTRTDATATTPSRVYSTPTGTSEWTLAAWAYVIWGTPQYDKINLAPADTPSTAGTGKYLIAIEGTQATADPDPPEPPGVFPFTSLSDVPHSLTGHPTQILRVRTDTAGLEFGPVLGSMAEASAADYTPTADLGSMAFASTADYTPTDELATVALSGFYGDLAGTPTLGALAAGNDAADVPYTPSGAMTAHDVQAAIDELENEKADTADLGSMAFASTADYTPTDDLAPVALSGAYSDLTGKPTLGTLAAGNDAADVPFAPAGGISATDVQAAVEELDAEKIAGTTGSADNRLLRADGTAGKTAQASAATLDDSGNLTGVAAATLTGLLTVNGQIAFPATQNPSANANTLDDYERGTFTPALSAQTTAPTSPTFTTQVGEYQKVGRHVLCVGRVEISGLGTGGAGNLVLTGLPFTVSDLGVPAGACAIRTDLVSWVQGGNTYTQVVGVPSRGGTTVLITASRDNGASVNLAWARLQAGSVIQFTVSYLAAA